MLASLSYWGLTENYLKHLPYSVSDNIISVINAADDTFVILSCNHICEFTSTTLSHRHIPELRTTDHVGGVRRNSRKSGEDSD